MGNLIDHARSSAAKFGGVPEDYFRLHEFLDSSKLFLPDWRHRALLHTLVSGKFASHAAILSGS